MTPVKRGGVLYKFKIFETNRFLDDLEEIGEKLKKKIYNKIQNYVYPQLKLNPFYGKNIKKLINYSPPTWRYRIGDYRLFYEIDQKENIIYILTIEIKNKTYERRQKQQTIKHSHFARYLY
jgi:mRNA interferase RelE/StbE